ncbi:hypothetical protein BDR04DRAFT_1141383 [Suillus decipiens]|nr:hypothetical protein BDR04DRAFT_1141383 [Suillus decipiens]
MRDAQCGPVFTPLLPSFSIWSFADLFLSIAGSIPSASAVSTMWLDPLLTCCLIGRMMDDLELKCDIKHFPFNIVDKGGRPAISIGYKGDTHQFVSQTCKCSARVGLHNISLVFCG